RNVRTMLMLGWDRWWPAASQFPRAGGRGMRFQACWRVMGRDFMRVVAPPAVPPRAGGGGVGGVIAGRTGGTRSRGGGGGGAGGRGSRYRPSWAVMGQDFLRLAPTPALPRGRGREGLTDHADQIRCGPPPRAGEGVSTGRDGGTAAGGGRQRLREGGITGGG